MAIFRAIIWGFIQGITEFIPISSSGHLVITPRFFGIEAPDLIFNIALHFGTLLAVLIYFRKSLLALFTSEKRLGLLVLLATLPIFICGAIFADSVKGLFEKPQAVGWLFILNGAILLTGHLRLRSMNPTSFKGYSPWRAFLIGVAQSLAILPGISRSGITIIAGIHAGFERREAYRFSFLLFIPATLLAFLYSIREAAFIKCAFNIEMLIGIAFSAIFGILALRLLLALLMKAKLYILGLYCIAIGLLTIYIF